MALQPASRTAANNNKETSFDPGEFFFIEPTPFKKPYMNSRRRFPCQVDL
jgi:hypothetical protein